MKNKYEFIAKTSDEALDLATKKLDCELSDLDVELEECNSGGILGIFKPKQIKVIVSFKDPSKDKGLVKSSDSFIFEDEDLDKNEGSEYFKSEEISKVVDEYGNVTTEEDEEEVDAEDLEEDGYKNRIYRERMDFAALDEEKKEEIKKEIEFFLKDIINAMKIDSVIRFIEQKYQLLIIIETTDGKSLIGYRGETLFALQYLLCAYLNQKFEKSIQIKLDINGYRRKKEFEIKKRVIRIARKVEREKKPIKLEPMHPSDRHYVHVLLKKFNNVYTKSWGEEPSRYVEICPR